MHLALWTFLLPACHQHEEVELAELMLRNQVHAEKLWFAGQAHNWPLADFYLHELEETTEVVIDGGITEDGHDISGLMQGLLPARIEAVEQAATGDGAGFDAAYDTLLEGCNSCHQQAEHGFVVIQRPTAPSFTSQDFAPR